MRAIPDIRPATGRYRSEQPGIVTWHCFSAGAHYDPGNVSFGPVVGVDEHLITPDAGFAWHPHAGVVIVSWVLSGLLDHQDDGGSSLRVGVGELLVQATGDGVRHREINGSHDEPLRLLQATLLLDVPRSVAVGRPPVVVGGSVTVDAVRSNGLVGPGHLIVTAGTFTLDDVTLTPGDSVRLDERGTLHGAGEAVLIAFEV